MADQSWLDILSECSYIAKILEGGGAKALARAGDGERLEWDAYPSSSMPDSAIARGRVGDPTFLAVARHAGGLDYEDPRDKERIAALEAKGLNPAVDAWQDRYDPIGTAVNRMLSQTVDASNRIAEAQQAAHQADGIEGRIFGIFGKDATPTWAEALGGVKAGLAELISLRSYIKTIDWPDEDQKTALRRLSWKLEDAKNRLRTAERAMREAVPVVIPEKSREVCKHCGTAKDVLTDFGAHPNYWIKSEAACQACLKRTAKGKAS